MKTKILILVTVFLTITSCSLSNDTNEGPVEVTLIHWNLINVTGGIAGVDNDFEVGDIVWNADEFNSVLAVNNSNTDNTIEDGLASGSYDFVLFEASGDIFTVIDGNEFGKIYISETDNTLLIIDQNELSFGPQADGFIYTFKITTSTIEI
ncbi:hypothetical protein [Seonamhaeicola maritimus]|uniref:Lipocalin-like domain-containing protein n=1 Tax=Seonamhaeicola maritimus TaxID=2591822 RepID=A0A5C7GDY9_9FLAO|nr:hypothetical protein [Seonamhaeicola maritimus]TXG34825.1 hypothetical protein FUA22_17125 [Seonamhaeicola maritimus]